MIWNELCLYCSVLLVFQSHSGGESVVLSVFDVMLRLTGALHYPLHHRQRLDKDLFSNLFNHDHESIKFTVLYVLYYTVCTVMKEFSSC